VHGESLVACAAWALSEARVTPVDSGFPWADLAALADDSGEPLVLHDVLCPMTPPAFIAACVERVVASGVAVVGTRPVTDTVKVVTDGFVGATVDRDGLLAVASPLVLPASVAATLTAVPRDLARTVTELTAAGHRVDTLPAPSEARRVTSVDALRVLEALTAPG
jgi:2-C-methyl-D-erythritol 4-phosphate cytidylyltransferase